MSEDVLMRPKRQGNYKAGPGRPKGSKNRSTLAIEAAAKAAVEAIDGAFVGNAHDFLAAVYRNPAIPLELRIVAASKALRVEKPALTAAQGRIDVQFNIAERLDAAHKRLAKGDGSLTDAKVEDDRD